MGKILGKSALCFAGLAVTSWLIQMLCDWMLQLYPKPLFFGLFWMTILEFIFWLVLPIFYSYLLFLLFHNEKNCCLIMVLNGSFVFLQHYILLVLRVDGVILASLNASKVAGSVILLALMYKQLRMTNTKSKMPSGKNNTKDILIMLSKSLLCFLGLVIAILGYNLLKKYALSIFGYWGFYLESPYFIWPMIASTYAFLIFQTVRIQRFRILILMINALLLLLIWGLIFIPYEGKSFSLIAVCGNTAIISIVLAFIFRSVEKHSGSIALPANQNAPEDSITPAQ